MESKRDDRVLPSHDLRRSRPGVRKRRSGRASHRAGPGPWREFAPLAHLPARRGRLPLPRTVQHRRAAGRLRRARRPARNDPWCTGFRIGIGGRVRGDVGAGIAVSCSRPPMATFRHDPSTHRPSGSRATRAACLSWRRPRRRITPRCSVPPPSDSPRSRCRYRSADNWASSGGMGDACGCWSGGNRTGRACRRMTRASPAS